MCTGGGVGSGKSAESDRISAKSETSSFGGRAVLAGYGDILSGEGVDPSAVECM